MSTTFQLGISSADAITLIPEEDFRNAKSQIRNEHRTRGGRLYVYKWADYRKINFALDLIPAADAATINSWWDTNTELLFFVNSDTETEVFSVLIMNEESPLPQYRFPYVEYYKGKLELETY